MEIQDVLKYFKIIRKWWWVIVLLFAATVGTLGSIAFLTKAQYEATVTLQVSAPPPQEVPLYSQFYVQALRDEIARNQASFSEFILEGDVPWRVVETLPDLNMTGNELHDNTSVEIPDNSQLLWVRVRAAESETAALLANRLVEVGLERYGKLLAQPTANTRQFIEQELEVARKELEAAEAELIQFQINNKVGSLDVAVDNQYQLIRSLELQSDLARSKGDVTQAQVFDQIILEREAELQNMVGISAEYHELVDRTKRARDTYDFLLGRRAEAGIKENQILDGGYIQIITPAQPPWAPATVISSKIIVLGAVVSILTGILLAVLLEYLEVSGAFRGFQKPYEPSKKAVAIMDQAS